MSTLEVIKENKENLPKYIGSILCFMLLSIVMMVFAIFPLLMYNGKRGFSNKYVQWMFYIFYPAHIILLVLFSRFLSQSPL